MEPFMKKEFSMLLCAGVLMLLSGCTVARIYATSGNNVALTQTVNKGGDAFIITERITFDYTGAIDVQEHLRAKYGSGHQFQNVTVKLKMEALDVLINIFTLGLAQSKTFEITGDKVS
jgi:hypothetical protein